MSRKGPGSMTHQVMNQLISMEAYGEKKHEYKKAEQQKAQENNVTWNPTKVGNKIFSIKTFDNYKYHALKAGKFFQKELGVKDIKKITPAHMAKYLNTYGEGKSPWTTRLVAAAMVKVFGSGKYTATDIKKAGGVIPARSREVLQRSRNETKGFSEERNRDVVDFAKATGLRREGLSTVTLSHIGNKNGQLHILQIKEKGGKLRDVRIRPDMVERVKEILSTKQNKDPSEPIFKGDIRCRMDVHGYRREYANRMYECLIKEKINKGKSIRSNLGTRRGTRFDKELVGEVVIYLGHSKHRYEVFTKHYSYE